MLRGEKVYLRAREEADVPVLHRELYDDVAAYSRADGRAWRPRPRSSGSPYDPQGPRDDVAAFSVVAVAGDELAGEALLWQVDLHNRRAHVGIALVPAVRGNGLGTETLELLSAYAFDVLGLNRLQVETLADNAAMVASAQKAGYVPEGRLRQSGWVLGEFADEMVLSLLADDWRAAGPRHRLSGAPAGRGQGPGGAGARG